MPNITILGSCRHQPYKILAVPEKNEMWNTEEGYQLAFKKFKKAIDESDLILVYAPDGVGEHTGRDLKYAESQGKDIVIFTREVRKKLIRYRIYHKDDPERYVDLNSANYWPMKIKERAVEASTVFDGKDHRGLRIRRLDDEGR